MSKSAGPVKITSLVILGNVLEYYDFLLFMHLGPIVTPLFFPSYSSKETHILSLLLFGLAFVIRPLGGYIFGRISDLSSRKRALTQSVKWAILPAFAIAFLPTYDTLGVAATALFVFFRLFQGIALGGEYPNAGTYLMEYYKKNHGLVSAILGASGVIGSLFGFSFALICLKFQSIDWLWRVGFFLGGIAGALSYKMRKVLIDLPTPNSNKAPVTSDANLLRLAIVTCIGMLVGTTTWLPMTYSNFYVTKILGMPASVGFQATLTALLGYMLITPLWGLIADLCNRIRYMVFASLLTIPCSLYSFHLLALGNIFAAQVLLILAAACFGAPIHAVMNSLFPSSVRGRGVAFLFMVGLSIGGIAPSLSSYIVDKTGFQYTPALLVSLISSTCALLFFKLQQHLKQSVHAPLTAVN